MTITGHLTGAEQHDGPKHDDMSTTTIINNDEIRNDD
jgi:hypothetical protein